MKFQRSFVLATLIAMVLFAVAVSLAQTTGQQAKKDDSAAICIIG